ncbi:MAG: hypothetical protein ACO3JL_15690 [Myxococcota bacterium]
MFGTWLFGGALLVSQVSMAPAPLPAGALFLLGATEGAAPEEPSGAANAGAQGVSADPLAPSTKSESQQQRKGQSKPGAAAKAAAAKAAAAKAAAAKAAAAKASIEKTKSNAAAIPKVSAGTTNVGAASGAIKAEKVGKSAGPDRRRNDVASGEENRRAALKEAAKHERILARIRRLRAVAAEAGDAALGARVDRLQALEDKRHRHIMRSQVGTATMEGDGMAGDDPSDLQGADQETP